MNDYLTSTLHNSPCTFSSIQKWVALHSDFQQLVGDRGHYSRAISFPDRGFGSTKQFNKPILKEKYR